MAEVHDMTHTLSVLVWDVPASVERGEAFSVKVGVKCSSECRSDAWTVAVRDQDAAERASAPVGCEPWPGTAALYYTEVDLIAPDAEGLHAWEAVALVGHHGAPHADAVGSFRVRVVPAPECLMTVVAVDRETQAPVAGAKVFVHPHEAFTDERGVADVRLPKGAYRLFVSGRRYFSYRSDGELNGDVTMRVELATDRDLSDADIWS